MPIPEPNTDPNMTLRERLKEKFGDVLTMGQAKRFLDYHGVDVKVYGFEFESRRRVDTLCDYVGLD